MGNFPSKISAEIAVLGLFAFPAPGLHVLFAFLLLLFHELFFFPPLLLHERSLLHAQSVLLGHAAFLPSQQLAAVR